MVVLVLLFLVVMFRSWKLIVVGVGDGVDVVGVIGVVDLMGFGLGFVLSGIIF